MPFKVNYIKEINVVESVFEGKTTLNEMKDSTVQALKIATDQGCERFLVDCSHLTRSSSVVELYSIAEYYSNIEVLHSIRQAVILPEDHMLDKELHFYETATRNRGYDVRAFTDRSKAIVWLTTKISL